MGGGIEQAVVTLEERAGQPKVVEVYRFDVGHLKFEPC